jgi:hypothetical protein
MEGKRSHWLRAAEVLILAATAITFAVNDQMRPALMFAIIGVAIIAATLWELRKPAAQEAVISPDGIAIPKGGMRQTIRWSEIEGVLLRHGILSIEMTGNRLIQRPVRSDVSIDVSRIEAYSTTLILKYEKERAANAAW